MSSLADRGLKATASYALFPSAPPDTQQVVDTVVKNGYGGVLTLLRLADQTRTVSQPGYTHQEAVLIRDLTGRFHTYYRDVYEPGSTIEEQILNFQSDLWRMAQGKGDLVWSSIVKVNESTSGDFIKDAIRYGFMPGLTNSGMVPK